MWISARRRFNFTKIYEIRLKLSYSKFLIKLLTVNTLPEKLNNRISSPSTLRETILIKLVFPISKPSRVVYGGLLNLVFYES